MGHYKKDKNWKKTHVAKTSTPQAPGSLNSNDPQAVASDEPETVRVTEISTFKYSESRNLMGAVVFFGPGAAVLSVEFASDYSAVQLNCFLRDCNSEKVQSILSILGEYVPLSSIYIKPASRALPVIANVVTRDPRFARRLKNTVEMGLRFYPVPKVELKILQMESGTEVHNTTHRERDTERDTENQTENQTKKYHQCQQQKRLKPDCVVCQTEAENPYQTSCGHWYCSACFESQCLYIKAGDIPVRCFGELGKCAQVFGLEELKKVLHETIFEKVLARSFAIYERSNHETFGICPASHCQQSRYRISANGAIITCPTCATSICTTCRVPSHSGMTCSAYQRAENVEFASWKKRKDVRDCPQCGAPIERDGGCQSLKCTVCKAGFCWDCMEV